MAIAPTCRLRWAALVAVCCLAGAANPIAVAQDAKPADPAPREYAERLNIQFSNGLNAYPELQLFGTGVDEFHKVEPQGLRFTMPAERPRLNEIGVQVQKMLKGDFEITLAFELLGLLKIGPPGGAGAVLDARFDTPDQAKVRLSRTQKDTGAYHGCSYLALEDGRDKLQPVKYPRADDKFRTGRLRLVRTGTDVAFQVEEGDTGFRTLGNRDVGGADVLAVRAWATSGWKAMDVDVRFNTLDIRWNPAAQVAGAPAPVNEVRPDPAIAQPAANTRTWLFIVIGAALLLFGLLVAIMLAWLLLGRRSSRGNVPAPASTSMVHFNCPSCAKNLKVKPSQAGKKVKCPQCGQAALVPEPQSAG
jgi:predicted RNA-binding Zn-ribbon protein involved in translation (DUF1610 family)